MRRMTSAVAAAIVLIFVLFGANAAPASAADAGAEADFVAALNSVRANNGLPPLAVYGELVGVGRGWADHMAAAGAISHNPNLSQVSANWTLLGENVGVGNDVGQLMAAFVASPGHLHNILEPRFDHVGVGVTWGADGRMYTSHVFMDLADAPAPAPPPAPRPAAAQAPAAPAAAPAPAPAAAPPAAPAPPPPPPVPVAPPAAAEPQRAAAVLAAVASLNAGVQ